MSQALLFLFPALVFALALMPSASYAACPSTLPAGDHWLKLQSGGRTREYLLHVPAGSASVPKALLLAWHGLNHDPVYISNQTEFSRHSDRLGNFYVAYPAGVSDSWNAGSCCAPATTLKIDDFQFARELVSEISRLLCVDSARVFTTGYSNGCFMSQGLICKAPDVFAASACGSGGEILTTDCDKEFSTFGTSLNVLEIHGTLDALVPYNGNALLGFPPVPENFAANVARMGCKTGPTPTFEKGNYYCEEYSNCLNGKRVEQCTVKFGVHDWFDDRDFSNSLYILQFLGLE